jgi:hypothetical protein
MPITVHPATHPARELFIKPATSAETLFQTSCPKESRQCKRFVQSSFTNVTDANICPSSNGLVMAVYEAYSQHHHLTIRPEDVWLSILTQLSYYVNAHAEELRSLFVSHEGKKQLVVVDVGDINTSDFGRLAVLLTETMEKDLLDSELREWIMPSFSTTTQTDIVTAAIIMMGTMQKYFSYLMSLICGIPSVTILGEKDDWINIRQRIEKLHLFGKEPEQFATLLSPVLDYIIHTFENPDNLKVVDFWTKIADKHSNGSGPSYLSGWITAFCFWDTDGKLLYQNSQDGCNIDGTLYHRVDTKDIPNAYVSVPVVVVDNGREHKTKMVAGLVGIAASSSGQKLDISTNHKHMKRTNPFAEPEFVDISPIVGDISGLDSLQPVSGWWMYEVADWALSQEF